MTTKTNDCLLANGMIVDGSGQNSYLGNVLIKQGKIEQISRDNIDFNGEYLDCTGKIIAPGFIDIHSHLDFFVAHEKVDYRNPFTQQGFTTFVGGNCGFSLAGFKKDSPHMQALETGLFQAGHDKIDWHSMAQYREKLNQNGISHNLLNLVGHGTTRTSIAGFSGEPLSQAQMSEMLQLLEEAMDQGAIGVSLGLQYLPGMKAPKDELVNIAKLVKTKGKLLTVHAHAYSTVSTAYPMNPFGEAHNIRSLRYILDIARETGVKLQLSHLIFVGTRTWKTCEKAIALIEEAIKDGVDVAFDIFAYPCGATLLSTLIPGSLEKMSEVMVVKLQAMIGFPLVGFGYSDIQLVFAGCDEYQQYEGEFVDTIAQKTGKKPFTLVVDLLRKSNYKARVHLYNYSGEALIEKLMQHPAATLMTDAWIEPSGFQNPSAYGSIPRFIRLARDKKLLSKESVIRKITGASADRIGLKDRGYLKENLAADITVFDWEKMHEQSTLTASDLPSKGVEHVFVNGSLLMKNTHVEQETKPGRCLLP